MSSLRCCCLGIVFWSAVVSGVVAEEIPPAQPVAHRTVGGQYQLGAISINPQERSVVFPVKFNQADGLLEYALVTPAGSAHESLLQTEVQPASLHAAMLLLGVAKEERVDSTFRKSGPLDAKSLKEAPRITGAMVSLTLVWSEAGKVCSAPLEDWILNCSTAKAMNRGEWIYNGSFIVGQTFAAQADGNMIALVTDPAALVNNPRVGNDDDQIWAVHKEVLPQRETIADLALKIELLGPKNFVK